MDTLTVDIGPDEQAGLDALIKLDGGAQSPTIERVARLALRQGLATNLAKASLPWAPSAEAVEERRLAVQAAPAAGTNAGTAVAAASAVPNTAGTTQSAADQAPKSRVGALLADRRVRLIGISAIAVAAAVVLIGGYVAKWSWTGFQSNNQLWDWMHLLILPVALGTLPLWLRYSQHMSTRRKTLFLVVIAAFIGFVIAGYVAPIAWTGFSGNNLWNWLTLLVLPITLTTIRTWPSSPKQINQKHITVFSVLMTAWVVTLIGGYVGTWVWTGYVGNTLWDWLQLLLVPLTFSTIVVPSAVKIVSGNAAERAREAAKEKAATATAARSRGVTPQQPVAQKAT